MRESNGFVQRLVGGFAPATWGRVPTLAFAIALGLGSVACGNDDEKRTLKPVQLGMTSDMGAIYDDGEMQLYEVKLPVRFPIRAPDGSEVAGLQQGVMPYGVEPFILNEDVKVQISWTLSNLDPDPHYVELLIDPWNEFGRYWPGLALVDAEDEESLPNLSGKDIPFDLPGVNEDRESRKHGVFTFQDMDELAIDFATVMNIIATAPPPDPMGDAEDNPAVALVNHTFAVENKSYNDPYIAAYIPAVIAGLTGIDLGLRTYEPANIAVEIVIEVVGKGEDSDKVIPREDDGDTALLPEPAQFITIGTM